MTRITGRWRTAVAAAILAAVPAAPVVVAAPAGAGVSYCSDITAADDAGLIMRVRWRDHGKRIRVKHIRGEFYGTGIFAYFSDGWLAAGGKYLRRDWTRSEPTFRVPRDVALSGFDDLVMGRLSDPTLTTVQQPLGHMAALAIELVVQQIRGERAPLRSELPTSFIARESCGCGLTRVLHTASSPSSSPSDFVRRNAPRLTELMIRSIPSPDLAAFMRG